MVSGADQFYAGEERRIRCAFEQRKSKHPVRSASVRAAYFSIAIVTLWIFPLNENGDL